MKFVMIAFLLSLFIFFASGRNLPKNEVKSVNDNCIWECNAECYKKPHPSREYCKKCCFDKCQIRTLSLYRKSNEPARWVPPKDEELIPVEE